MQIFNIIFPIFTIALLGYVLTAIGYFTPQGTAGLSSYVFKFAIPILLFNAMSNIVLPERIEWPFLIAYFGVGILNFILGIQISWSRFNQKRKGQAIFGLGACYSNMVLIGLPVITTALGDQALLPMLLLITFNSPIFFSLVTLVAESQSRTLDKLWSKLAQPFVKVVQNPIIIGLALGLLFNYFAIPLPVFVEGTIQIIRGSALPCALFVLGASLTEYKLSGQLDRAMWLVGLKMLVHPLLVWALLTYLFEIDPLWRTVAVIAASLPIGINTAVFAYQYRSAVAPVSTAILISTLISIGSLSYLLWYFV